MYELALAGAIGAVFGLYLYGEVGLASEALGQANRLWWARDVLAGITLGGSIGFFLNASAPLRDGAWYRLAREATWGALAGACGGIVGLIVGELVLGGLQGGWLGRSVSWAILGLGIGASQGLATRSRQRLLYGLLGGGLGGWLGGLVFELLRDRLGAVYDPARSQGLGIVVLGAGLGLCLALVEQVLRRAWIQVLQGRQEGRAYLLPQRVNRLGLDEHAEVGIFGDAAVARQHAVIERTEDRYALRNLDGANRTEVNGEPVVDVAPLRDGDRITLGRTALLFRHRGAERAAEPGGRT